MKSFVLVLAVAVGVLSTGCLEKSKAAVRGNALFRSHFIGMANLSAGTNATKLKEIWALPQSEALRDQALRSIASAPFKLWQKSLPGGAKDEPWLIRPLLDDLLAAESYVELNGPDSSFDSVMALELKEERAQLWQTNLAQLLSDWKLPKSTPLSGSVKGWEITGTGPQFKLQHSGKWLLLGWSLGKVSRINSLAETLAKTGRPVSQLTNAALVSFNADFRALSRWIEPLQKFKIPPAEVTILPRGEYLRTEARIALSEPLKWKFQPWNFPTNQIRDPLASFTAAQAIEPVLKSIPGFTQLGLEQVPSQVCAWSHENFPFGSYWVFPMRNASNAVRTIAPRAKEFVKHYVSDPMGELVYVTNRSELAWTGLLLTIPTVASLSDSNKPGEYFLAALLPLLRRTNAPPAELFAQLGNRKDLIYYDWELTSDRLHQAGLFYQVLDIVNRRTISNTNIPSVQWSDHVSPQLGNTITEITVTSPTELNLIRKSHLGLTGFELATLLRWIDSPSFPLEYEPPPTFRRKPSRPAFPSPP